MLCAGNELAEAASEALGTTLEFEDVSESVLIFPGLCEESAAKKKPGCRAEAKKVLNAQSDNDESEKQYILEYYSLVRQGSTNYIATTAFHDVTGAHPTEPTEFFKLYSDEFAQPPKKKRLRA